ncbi:MAG: hypothetical protein ACTS7E_01115 [Arsenophonus sp. NC-CH8-MAG3]
MKSRLAKNYALRTTILSIILKLYNLLRKLKTAQGILICLTLMVNNIQFKDEKEIHEASEWNIT